jgi:hypothetical protein
MESDKEYDKIIGALDKDTEKEAIIERDKRMSECFRRVFSTDEGRLVLHQILVDLKFYETENVTETSVTLNNFAKFMIFKRLKCDNYKQMTSVIFDCNKH